MLMNFLIEKFTEESYPEVQTKKCIYNKSNLTGCNKCKEICPKGAIELKDKKVYFNENLCNKCGLCRAVCPTQAIMINGLGEQNILRTIKEQKDIIFSCFKEGGAGTLKLSCLNALHPELLAALFILYGDSTFYFNISRCESCEVINSDLLLELSLKKAESFVKLLGIESNYKIIKEKDELNNIPKSIISRRDLFSLIKKQSANIATQTVETIVIDKNNYLSIRKTLLKAIEEKKDLIKNNIVHNTPFFECWNVNNNCNGCGVCQKNCPNGAWKLEEVDDKLMVYHNSGKCYKCGICLSLCPQKAIEKGDLSIYNISLYNLKKEISLVNCTSCNKKFIPSEKNETRCATCKKRDILRNKISNM